MQLGQLVGDFDPETAALVGCSKCSYQITDIDTCMMAMAYPVSCPACDGTLGPVFDCGAQCRNCEKLDYSMPVDGCCSRACALQVEYAKTLGEAA